MTRLPLPMATVPPPTTDPFTDRSGRPVFIDLDANATTRPAPEVIDVIARRLRDTPGNPGSRHALGRQARRVLEAARDSIAAILHAEPDELIFTSGGTEANHLAILGLRRGPAGTILLSPGEHPSSREACTLLTYRGDRLRPLPVDAHGQLVATALLDIDPASTRLAAVLYAHNETGVIQDVTPLREWTQKHHIPWHLDAVQAVGKIPVDFAALGCTTLSFAAHKFHGPRGIGGLLVRSGTTLQPQFVGGHQEHNQRAGTEPVALIAGMARALELADRAQQTRLTKLAQLRDQLQDGLMARCAPSVIHAATVPRLPNTLNIAFPGVDGEALLVALDLAGIGCSLGSTCASGSTEPSPLLVAMGCPIEILKSSLRLSLSIDNTPAEIAAAVDRIARTVAQLRQTAPQP